MYTFALTKGQANNLQTNGVILLILRQFRTLPDCVSITIELMMKKS